MRQGRLADARQILDQQVSTGQQAGQRQLELCLLAENDAPGGGEDFGDAGGFFADGHGRAGDEAEDWILTGTVRRKFLSSKTILLRLSWSGVLPWVKI